MYKSVYSKPVARTGTSYIICNIATTVVVLVRTVYTLQAVGKQIMRVCTR